MNLKKYCLLPVCASSILMTPFFIACGTTVNEDNKDNNSSIETKANSNLMATELSLSGTINDNKSIINKEWIITNKDKLFIGNIDNLTDTNQILELSFSDGSDQKSLIINLKLAKGSTYGSNQQPTTNDTSYSIVIIGFDIKEYPPTILQNNLIASSLNLTRTAESNINIINSQWIVQNKAIIFTGSLEFLTNTNQVTNISVSVDSNNNTILNISLTLQAGSFVDDNKQISSVNKQFSFNISGFEEPTQNYEQTQPKSDLSASTFDFSGTINKNKSKITDQWILTNRAKIFDGTIDLLNSSNQITNIIIISENNDTIMKLSFTLAAGSFVNDQNQISQSEKVFEMSISGFTTPLAQTTINQNLQASTFSFTGTAKSNSGHITTNWIFTNKDTIFEGTNNLITEEEDIEIKSLYFPTARLTRMEINILLAANTSVNSYGDINTVATAFTIVIDNFEAPVETKLKENITASSLNLTGTVGDNIKAMTMQTEVTKNYVNMDKDWILSNLDKFFDGTTDLITSDNIKSAETTSNPTFATTYSNQLITSFTFTLELRGYSIYDANGKISTESKTFNITINDFENISSTFTYNPKYVFASTNRDEDIDTVMNSIDRNYIFQNYSEIINVDYRTNIYSEEYCKDVQLRTSYQIEDVKVFKNKEQLPWKGDTEHETFFPIEPDENTQLRVEIILSKNVFLDENNTWNSEKACILYYIFFKNDTTN